MSYFLIDETGRQSGARQAAHPKPPRGPIGVVRSGLRFYRPELGRWLSRDPIEEPGGLNLLAFVHNNPIGLVDTDGRVIYPPAFKPFEPWWWRYWWRELFGKKRPPKPGDPRFGLPDLVGPPTCTFNCYDPDPAKCELCCAVTTLACTAELSTWFAGSLFICARAVTNPYVSAICISWVTAKYVEAALDLAIEAERCPLRCPCRIE